MRFLLALLLVSLIGPSLLAADEAQFQSIFDGKTLAGWKASEAKESFKVEDGAIVVNGKPRSHLFYVCDDKPLVNFEFKADVMTKPGSNSGIYIHTQHQEAGWPKYGYEVQVNNTHADPIKTGSLYQVSNIKVAPAKDDQWFTMVVRVEGKRITVTVDGKTINDYTEPEGKEPGKDFTRVLDKGAIALQAHDPKSVVLYKNLQLKRLP